MLHGTGSLMLGIADRHHTWCIISLEVEVLRANIHAV
jgi:hypothetical protein